MEGFLITIKKLLPGLIGALLAAITGPQRDKASRAIGFVSGFSIAMYFTDPILHFFALNADAYGSGVGFALGYFGMSTAESGLKAIRDTEWASIIKDRLSK